MLHVCTDCFYGGSLWNLDIHVNSQNMPYMQPSQRYRVRGNTGGKILKLHRTWPSVWSLFFFFKSFLVVMEANGPFHWPVSKFNCNLWTVVAVSASYFSTLLSVWGTMERIWQKLELEQYLAREWWCLTRAWECKDGEVRIFRNSKWFTGRKAFRLTLCIYTLGVIILPFGLVTGCLSYSYCPLKSTRGLLTQT